MTTTKGNEPTAGRDERALIRDCCCRKPGAWEEFLVRFNKLIYYSIHRTLSVRHYYADSDEVEDLFSEVLVHFIKDDFKKLRLYRGDEGCSVATWIRTVTVRYTIDYLRSRSRQHERVDIEGEEIGMEVSLKNPVSQPDQVFEEREEDRLLSAAIAALPENDRYFIELYYGRGLSPDQTAKILGLSTKSVYSRVNRLKTKIGEEIERLARKST